MIKSTPAKNNVQYAMDVFYTHVVAAHMLFPRNEQNRLGYVCLGLNSITSKLLASRTPPEELFPLLLSLLRGLFAEVDYYKAFISDYPGIVTEWDVFQDLVANTRFSASGKGSIEEAMVRGKIAGYVLTYALNQNVSLAKAAECLVKDQKIFAEHIKNAFVITKDNIINNIWPEFKKSAHLWAATNDFAEIELTQKPVCKTILLNLYDICANPIPMGNRLPRESLELFPPSKYLGWQAFLDKANSVLKICEENIGVSGNARPILKRDECWVFPVEIQ